MHIVRKRSGCLRAKATPGKPPPKKKSGVWPTPYPARHQDPVEELSDVSDVSSSEEEDDDDEEEDDDEDT